MYSNPLHHQADHPALVVKCVVHPLLFRALQGLGMVGAQQLKIKTMEVEQSVCMRVMVVVVGGGVHCGFHRGGKKHLTTLGNIVLKGYWAINTGHS